MPKVKSVKSHETNAGYSLPNLTVIKDFVFVRQSSEFQNFLITEHIMECMCNMRVKLH